MYFKVITIADNNSVFYACFDSFVAIIIYTDISLHPIILVIVIFLLDKIRSNDPRALC